MPEIARTDIMLSEQLPAWQHLGTEKTMTQNQQSRCLTKKRESTKVKDMLRITDRLRGEYERGTHQPVLSCQCEDCTTDREDGCENPQCCAIETQKRLDRITPQTKPHKTTKPRQPNVDKATRRSRVEPTKRTTDKELPLTPQYSVLSAQ